MSVLPRDVRICFVPDRRPKPDPAIEDRLVAESIVAEIRDDFDVDRFEAKHEIERLMQALKARKARRAALR
jgi:hypothetical protein